MVPLAGGPSVHPLCRDPIYRASHGYDNCMDSQRDRPLCHSLSEALSSGIKSVIIHFHIICKWWVSMPVWDTRHVSSQLYLEVCFLHVCRPFELGHMQLLWLSETTGRPFKSQDIPACSQRTCKRVHEACTTCNADDTGDVNGSQKSLWDSFSQVQWRNKASFTRWFRVST